MAEKAAEKVEQGSQGRKVLAAVDASPNAKRAFDWYCDNIHREEDTILVVHIPEVPSLPSFSPKQGFKFPAEEWQNAISAQLAKVNGLEEQYKTILQQRKFKYEVKSVHHSSPGQGIVAAADTEGVDMIVMGTRGLDQIRRTLIGSVSDYVVRQAHIPVLVCPPGR